ncbi:class F sortase [Kitasatospora sp. NBC_01287]|uniref:class F sortase n=1 Tax=Kitasatospora sp. NBC_01287 TaxID=2903573 RepID=UPI00225486A6|nr:class F sortase [Kitasatospora sp. NBC_01287]MCX4751069.1 class F sortase [Kitasatospora sp. NBC_01287]
MVSGATAAAVASGLWLLHEGIRVTGPPQPLPPTAAGQPQGGGDGARATAAARSPQPDAAPMPPSDPVRIRIPSIRVDAPVTGLGLDPDRHLSTPPVAVKNLVGWYRDGASPGAVGNAIAIGHVDTMTGPAVFYLLGLLHPGDLVEVTRRDHRIAVFTIDAVRVYPKSAFPDTAVYGPTRRSELHLITCGGSYDKRSGYQSNTVVSAHLTAGR